MEGWQVALMSFGVSTMVTLLGVAVIWGRTSERIEQMQLKIAELNKSVEEQKAKSIAIDKQFIQMEHNQVQLAKDLRSAIKEMSSSLSSVMGKLKDEIEHVSTTTGAHLQQGHAHTRELREAIAASRDLITQVLAAVSEMRGVLSMQSQGRFVPQVEVPAILPSSPPPSPPQPPEVMHSRKFDNLSTHVEVSTSTVS